MDAIPQLADRGLTGRRDFRKLVVFKYPPVSEVQPPVHLLYLHSKNVTQRSNFTRRIAC